MDEPDLLTRRRLLALAGLAANSGLAGCNDGPLQPQPTSTEQQRSGTTDRTTESTSTTQGPSAPTADLEAEVNRSSDEIQVVVRGHIAAEAGLKEVSIRGAGKRHDVKLNGNPRRQYEDSITVNGGQDYTISVTVTDEAGTQTTVRIQTGYVALPVEPLPTTRLVGAHYYPWYEMHAGHENWTDRTPATPVLGEYAADDPAVIDQHLVWCLEHGIRWLSMSWWGPDSGTDRALRNQIMTAEHFDAIQFSILYETVGRLEDFDYDLSREDAQQQLVDDFQYLADQFFGDTNYLHLDDRPVVFVYVARILRGDVTDAFDRVAEDVGVRPYVLGDFTFGAPPDTGPAIEVADAVTAYNPYSARPDIEAVFHDQFERGSKLLQLGARAAGKDYVPVVIPGYNDTELPDDQRVDNPILAASPRRYERVCEQVLPHLADAEAVLITSFNEWYENTQVEPNEEFGEQYLNITARTLAQQASPGYGTAGTMLRLEFNQAIQPAEFNPDSTDRRFLSFLADSLSIFDGKDELVAYDIGTVSAEPLFVGGAFSAEGNNKSTWRWFGGETPVTQLFIEADISAATRAELVGYPIRSDAIDATVYINDQLTDRVEFGDRRKRAFDISLVP